MNYKIIHNELELREIKWYKQCYGKIVQSMYDSILDNVMVSSKNTTITVFNFFFFVLTSLVSGDPSDI